MKLRHIEFALPDKRYSSEEIAAWAGIKPEFLKKKIGIEWRHFLSTGESVIELCSTACNKLFGTVRALNRQDIGLLVVITQNPDYPLPHTSALLQDRLGLSNNCACFDLSLGCSGYVYGYPLSRNSWRPPA